jgi:hypothetical protein
MERRKRLRNVSALEVGKSHGVHIFRAVRPISLLNNVYGFIAMTDAHMESHLSRVIENI